VLPLCLTSILQPVCIGRPYQEYKTPVSIANRVIEVLNPSPTTTTTTERWQYTGVIWTKLYYVYNTLREIFTCKRPDNKSKIQILIHNFVYALITHWVHMWVFGGEIDSIFYFLLKQFIMCYVYGLRNMFLSITVLVQLFSIYSAIHAWDFGIIEFDRLSVLVISKCWLNICGLKYLNIPIV